MEEKFNNKYRIDSVRKENWDYGNNGRYFVTICTKNMVRYFGEIYGDACDASLRTTEVGKVVQQFWNKIPEIHTFANIDEFILMPNHLHGILLINKENMENIKENYSNKFGPQSKNLSSIVRGFKGSVKSYADKNNLIFEWQKGYYDRIIRNEDELNRIRKYIRENPYKWDSINQNYEPNIFV
jgi:REP element-mobilizing transposase RayT